MRVIRHAGTYRGVGGPIGPRIVRRKQEKTAILLRFQIHVLDVQYTCIWCRNRGVGLRSRNKIFAFLKTERFRGMPAR